MTKWVLLAALVGSGGAWFGWQRYEDHYYSHTDHAYHAQCPNNTGEYYDCDWWPRSGT